MSEPRQQLTGYQVRPLHSAYGIYLVRADGSDVPVDRQFAVYTRADRTSAQVLADALNNGLLSRIVQAVHEERTAERPGPAPECQLPYSGSTPRDT